MDFYSRILRVLQHSWINRRFVGLVLLRYFRVVLLEFVKQIQLLLVQNFLFQLFFYDLVVAFVLIFADFVLEF